MNSSTTYEKKYYENNKILLFPEKPRELQIIEKIPCQYCGRLLTAVELSRDKKKQALYKSLPWKSKLFI